MADVAISGLTALGGAPATNDLLVEVDVSDTTQAPTGTTKKMTVANLFTAPTITTLTVSSGGISVTGNSAITGSLALSGGIIVTGGSIVAGSVVKSAASGLVISGATGSVSDLVIATPGGGNIITVPTGTVDTQWAGDFAINTNKFTVAAATGNTVVAGTLGVSGATATMPLLVGIGGLTAAFPALKRSGATLEVRAADDSGYTNLNVSALSTATGDVFSQTNVTASTGVFKVGANQVVGARNTGWAAQTVTTGAKTDIGASGTWTTTSVGNLLMAHHATLLAHGLIGA